VDSDRQLPTSKCGRRKPTTEYAVTLKRTPGISDGEVKARLSRIYRLLLEIARREETADAVEAANPEPSASADQHVQAQTDG
jgi:hypothetical protein